jgi:RNA polymerase sigma factor (sigma-70 family)
LVKTATADDMTSLIRQDQAEFYRQHVDALFGAAMVRCRDRQMAEDLVQETFVKLFRRWPERGTGSAVSRAYAMKTLANQYIDELRRRQVRVQEIPDGLGEHAFVRVEPSSAVGSDIDDEVRAAIRQLPTQQREVIVHVYYEGLSLAEAAGVMGLGPKTVHNYHFLAKRRLEAGLSHLADRAKEQRDER